MAGEGDRRKRFISSTAANYFGLEPAGGAAALAAGLHSRPELSRFLDDGNEFLLVVQHSGAQLSASNKIEATDSKNNVLVFFKLRPDVITEDNLHSNILVSSMLDSPINTLYQAVRQVFAPVLLKDEKWSKTFDPKLQKLLSELEAGLSTALRRSDPSYTGTKFSEDDVRAILTPTDEFQFWRECAHRGHKGCSKERASYFRDLFEDIAKDYYNLDTLSLFEVVDLVEATKDTVDSVWRQTEHDPYPQSRMHNLLDVIGGSLGRFVQRKLATLNLWEDTFHSVKENIQAGILVCEQWVSACEYLTGQLWQHYTLHPWKNEKYFPELIAKLGQRLDEVLTVRTLHEKLMFFLPAGEKNSLHLSHVFEPFAGLNPVHYNPYTEPLWRAAVSQYERIIAPVEQKIATKLKKFISEIQDSPLQLLQIFQKHKELIKHPKINKELLFERETLLAALQDYVKDYETDFGTRCHGVPGDVSGPLSGKNLSEVVNNIVWVQQLELKVDDSIKLAEALLSDLSGFQTFHQSANSFLEQLKVYEQEQFDDWSRNIQSELSNPKSGLCIQANSPVMELDPISGTLNILYSDRLVTLLREVRQLSALGFAIPTKIQHLANTAQKFCKQAVILKQVAHFYNSIDQQMIWSQKPMMLQSALAFEQIIKHPKSGPGGKAQITWDNPRELEAYIQKLQGAAERISTENRKLRKWHTNFIQKVISLMNIDLLRQQQRWKDGLQELRTGFASLESQGFKSSDMKAWRQHWNHQLYKALEHQYQMGLEALNENLPEIIIDLTFKQGRLQFRPPFEEVRARYYREMKRFISIPNQFRGVSEAEDESIFTVMTERNANGFLTAFSKAEDLFRRLTDVSNQFKEWVVIGQVDMEHLVKTHLSSKQDWEKNFKALKVRGKEAERLPSTIRIDCLTVNCNPVKTVIDDFIQKLYDILVVSLRKSIQEAEDKNKLLRTVAGAGLDSISNLRATWEKFELMMESHQLMIAEQMEVMKGNVLSRVNVYLQDLEKFKARWDQLKPSDDVIETGGQDVLEQSAQMIKEKKKEFDELKIMKEKLIEECRHFKLEEPDLSLSEAVSQDIQSCADVWALYEEFYQGFQEKAKEDWITFRSKIYLFEEFLFNWHDRLRKMKEHTVMTVKLQKEVDKYKMIIPLLKYVRGEHLSPDHWLDLFRLLGLPRGTTLEGLLFGDLLKVTDAIIENAMELKV
uniref:DYHC2 protein n=1 Tax=Junco hyemalis TaxID=40217 RepID=A0A8C5IE70_JUNHY